jgi:hypothetical protein
MNLRRFSKQEHKQTVEVFSPMKPNLRESINPRESMENPFYAAENNFGDSFGGRTHQQFQSSMNQIQKELGEQEEKDLKHKLSMNLSALDELTNTLKGRMEEPKQVV